MRLVHGDQRHRDFPAQFLEGGRLQALGRDVDHPVEALARILQRQGKLPGRQRGIQVRGAHARLVEGGDLVLHQRNQGRDDQRHPLQQQGRHLVAQGLARAGGHDAERVPPFQERADDLPLPGPEGVVAEVPL